jgi:hypothetical protein
VEDVKEEGFAGGRKAKKKKEIPLTFSRVVRVGTSLVGTSVEVFDEGRRVLAEVSEVNSLSSLLKEKETIESLEEFRRRLMDSSENSLCNTRRVSRGLERLGKSGKVNSRP